MRIGILGGGQLGRMLALDAHRLGLEPRVLEPRPDCPAAAVARTLTAPYTDAAALSELARCDVVTYEFENVPADALEMLAGRVAVHPARSALVHAGDRLLEKRLFRRLRIPTNRFRPVDSPGSLRAAAAELGLPAVLKTRRFGYDGKGQAVLRRPSDLETAWEAVGARPSILEEFVPFDREVSVLGVRGRDGRIRFWPVTENRHVDGILRISRAPAPDVHPTDAEDARTRIASLLDDMDYVGVVAVEFFVRGRSWIANEMACRVHNSGHWTIEGSTTSQFENHLRAIAGLPLGSTDARHPAAMVNLVGRLPRARDVLAVPGATLHVYGKSPAPGRKLGHATVVARSEGQLERKLERLVRRLGDPALERALARGTRERAPASDTLPALRAHPCGLP